jgi:hypothetical protein
LNELDIVTAIKLSYVILDVYQSRDMSFIKWITPVNRASPAPLKKVKLTKTLNRSIEALSRKCNLFRDCIHLLKSEFHPLFDIDKRGIILRRYQQSVECGRSAQLVRIRWKTRDLREDASIWQVQCVSLIRRYYWRYERQEFCKSIES